MFIFAIMMPILLLTLEKAFDLCNEIIVEEYLTDVEEYNVAVANGYISNAYMINNEGDFSFTDKYDNLEKGQCYC
ncbi:MAG: hypothetical protein L6U99_08195 [Clostridium sp.]|nr:MAG: hypothetical protein L6U99_08195 [Clostridium sp.]